MPNDETIVKFWDRNADILKRMRYDFDEFLKKYKRCDAAFMKAFQDRLDNMVAENKRENDPHYAQAVQPRKPVGEGPSITPADLFAEAVAEARIISWLGANAKSLERSGSSPRQMKWAFDHGSAGDRQEFLRLAEAAGY